MATNTKAKQKGIPVGTRRTIAYVVLAFVTIMCLFWFFVLFINSTRNQGELTRGFTLVPGKHMISNFKEAKSQQPIFTGLRNSFIVAILSAALCTYFSTLTAFAIYAYDFKLKKFIFGFILAVMMIPTQVTALGFIQLIRKIGMYDSFLPLFLPAIASPVVFFYMKQSMDSTLPIELLESSRIDGASELLIFNKIALPIMKPAIAVQAIFSFVTSWNNYFTPALVLDSRDKKTLPILIALLRAADYSKFNMGCVYMFVTCSILPVVVVYLILSKNIVAGMTVGAVKG